MFGGHERWIRSLAPRRPAQPPVRSDVGALAIITLSILFLSVYAVRWIVSPLSSIASAARDFGRAGADEGGLGVGGPRRRTVEEGGRAGAER